MSFCLLFAWCWCVVCYTGQSLCAIDHSKLIYQCAIWHASQQWMMILIIELSLITSLSCHVISSESLEFESIYGHLSTLASCSQPTMLCMCTRLNEIWIHFPMIELLCQPMRVINFYLHFLRNFLRRDRIWFFPLEFCAPFCCCCWLFITWILIRARVHGNALCQSICCARVYIWLRVTCV